MKEWRTAEEIARVFRVSAQVVYNTMKEIQAPFELRYLSKKKIPKKVFAITDEEFKTLRDGLADRGQDKLPVHTMCPYISILLTPWWRVFMPYNIVEHPIELIELNIETSHHPDLIREINEMLVMNPNAGFEERLATIATHCNVLVDGEYAPDDLRGLCTLLTVKLQEMRTGILRVTN